MDHIVTFLFNSCDISKMVLKFKSEMISLSELLVRCCCII